MKKSENKRTFLIIGILLILSLLLNMYLGYKTNSLINSDILRTYKSSVIKSELSEAKNEINKYIGINKKLDETIEKANKDMKRLENKLFTQTSANNKYQKEIEELTILKDKYLEEIDSLLLIAEIEESLNKTIDKLENELTKLKEKVGIGESMISDNVIVIPMKQKANDQFSNTALAKKTDVIKVCFDIIQNKLIPPGDKIIYLRIISPNGEVLFDEQKGSGLMIHPEFDVKAQYSVKKAIRYNNEKENYCMQLESDYSFVSGIYVVELFSDKNKIGVQTLLLR